MKRKIYLIFQKEKPIGYTDDRKTVKSIRRQRSHIRIVEAQVPRPNSLDVSEITVFPTFAKYALNVEEGEKVKEVMINLITEMHIMYLDLRRFLTSIKFDDKEQERVSAYCLLLERMVDDLMHEETCVMVSDYFNVIPIIEKVIKQ